MFEIFIKPFIDFAFMQNALLACVAVSISSAPIGVFLVLRRMTLMSDAMSHALLPGVAIGYLVSGLSLTAMTIGGIFAGLIIVLASGVITRSTIIREDASLATFYLLALALGIVIISIKSNSIDLLNLLFGSILAVDNSILKLLFSFCAITLICLILIYKTLIIECLDSDYLRTVSKYRGAIVHYVYLILLVINLVAGFHALGTLMSVGMLVIPASCTRFWIKKLFPMILLAGVVSIIGAYCGILISYHFELPVSASIILTLGVFYIFSMLVAPMGIIRYKKPPSQHLKA